MSRAVQHLTTHLRGALSPDRIGLQIGSYGLWTGISIPGHTDHDILAGCKR